MELDIIPDAPFDTKAPYHRCPHDATEVAQPGQLCAPHGGPPATPEILRRIAHRQVRGSLRAMVLCSDCALTSLREPRCSKCTWIRGALMGMAGLLELLGCEKEFEPYVKLVAIYDPGWKDRVKI